MKNWINHHVLTFKLKFSMYHMLLYKCFYLLIIFINSNSLYAYWEYLS